MIRIEKSHFMHKSRYFVNEENGVIEFLLAGSSRFYNENVDQFLRSKNTNEDFNPTFFILKAKTNYEEKTFDGYYLGYAEKDSADLEEIKVLGKIPNERKRLYNAFNNNISELMHKAEADYNYDMKFVEKLGAVFTVNNFEEYILNNERFLKIKYDNNLLDSVESNYIPFIDCDDIEIDNFTNNQIIFYEYDGGRNLITDYCSLTSEINSENNTESIVSLNNRPPQKTNVSEDTNESNEENTAEEIVEEQSQESETSKSDNESNENEELEYDEEEVESLRNFETYSRNRNEQVIMLKIISSVIAKSFLERFNDKINTILNVE